MGDGNKGRQYYRLENAGRFELIVSDQEFYRTVLLTNLFINSCSIRWLSAISMV